VMWQEYETDLDGEAGRFDSRLHRGTRSRPRYHFRASLSASGAPTRSSHGYVSLRSYVVSTPAVRKCGCTYRDPSIRTGHRPAIQHDCGKQ
jgi:hypothetical protein